MVTMLLKVLVGISHRRMSKFLAMNTGIKQGLFGQANIFK
jgi:hypothetical protein